MHPRIDRLRRMRRSLDAPRHTNTVVCRWEHRGFLAWRCTRTVTILSRKQSTPSSQAHPSDTYTTRRRSGHKRLVVAACMCIRPMRCHQAGKCCSQGSRQRTRRFVTHPECTEEDAAISSLRAKPALRVRQAPRAKRKLDAYVRMCSRRETIEIDRGRANGKIGAAP